MDDIDIDAALAGLEGWEPAREGRAIARRFAFRDFAAAVETANLAAWLGNRRNHHPDVAFGWGYCTVTFTTHDAGGVTARDIDCARRLNALMAED